MPLRMQGILERLVAHGQDLDIINFTGGEPTLHPELPTFLAMSRDAGIRRLTVSTNGLKLLDEGYVRALADLDVRVVISLDTLDPHDRARLSELVPYVEHDPTGYGASARRDLTASEAAIFLHDAA